MLKFSRRRAPLLPLMEVKHRLELVEQGNIGIQPIRVDSIVGTLDRSRDFDRQFRPLRPEQQAAARLDMLRKAFPNNDFPPIAVYEIGGAYFVSDGYHRVALARERGILELDAEITQIRANYALPPDVDIRQVIHTQQRQQFMAQSGLARSRPDADIEFSCPHGYPELLELIKAYGFDLQQQSHTLLTPAEVAADWYDGVYLPGVTALRHQHIADAYPYKKDADLFLWMYQQRRRLLIGDPRADYEQAARAVRQARPGLWRRRELRRSRSSPLRPMERS